MIYEKSNLLKAIEEIKEDQLDVKRFKVNCNCNTDMILGIVYHNRPLFSSLFWYNIFFFINSNDLQIKQVCMYANTYLTETVGVQEFLAC